MSYKEYYNEATAHEIVDYIINVKESLEKYKDVYGPYISSNKYNQNSYISNKI